MSARDELDGLIARLTPRHGRDGRDGRDGNDGADGQPGERGERGPVPKHVWSGTALKIEQPGGAWAEPVELKGEKGDAGYSGQDGRDGVDGKDGNHGKDGGRGGRGEAGKAGETGPRGPQGPIGPMPEHEWDASRLRFELAPNVWGQWTDLRGPAGRGGGGGGGMSEDIADLRYLQLGGGTLTGALVLPGDPTDPLEAVTKQYVDAHAGGGGGVSGLTPAQVTIGAADGTLAQAAQFSYADSGFDDGSFAVTVPNYIMLSEASEAQDYGALNMGTPGTTGDVASASIYIYTGRTNGTETSGELIIQTGDTQAGNSGDVILSSGFAGAGGSTGVAHLYSSDSASASTGEASLRTGAVHAGNGTSGPVNISSGDTDDGQSGTVLIRGGNNHGEGYGGKVQIRAGRSFGAGAGGNVEITAGASVSGTAGHILLQSNTVASGTVTLAGNPGVALEAATKQYVDAHGFTSPLTTKGDIYTRSTADARLPVGSNNQVVIADSAQTLGLKWGTLAGANVSNTPSGNLAASDVQAALNELQSDIDTRALASVVPGYAFKNALINADFSLNQRSYVSGAATTIANQYTLDRWRVVTSGQNLAFSALANGRQITAPAGGVEQVIEGANVKGGTYTLSWTGTATASINGSTVANGGTATLTANTNATVRLISGTASCVQLESGGITTEFASVPYEVELQRCMRYFERMDSAGAFKAFGGGHAITATIMRAVITLKVSKRIEGATVTTSATSTFAVGDSSGNHAVTAFSPVTTKDTSWISTTTSGLVAGAGCLLVDNNVAAWIAFDAEL